MVYRQPFPGPGLGIRCPGAITHAINTTDVMEVSVEHLSDELIDHLVQRIISEVPGITIDKRNRKTTMTEKDRREAEETLAQNMSALEGKIIDHEAVIERQRQRIELLKKRNQELQSSYDVISSSHFWKLTKPIRIVWDKVRGFHRNRKKDGGLIKKEVASVSERDKKKKMLLEGSEPLISKDWIDSQRHKPMISIVIAAKR